MGSGSSSSYSGTIGGSQPYAESYHVVPEALGKDKKDPDIYDKKKGYFKNPTATDLETAIHGDRIMFNSNKVAHGSMTYVPDQNGHIIFGKRLNPNKEGKHAPHPTLIGGKHPKVQCAGILTIHNGKICAIDNQNGHFKPNIKSMTKVDAIMRMLCKSSPKLFSPTSKWRKE